MERKRTIDWFFWTIAALEVALFIVVGMTFLAMVV